MRSSGMSAEGLYEESLRMSRLTMA
jgi:hypothetical protein